MDTQNYPEEYRFLTFLFCDLVDSTPLSQALSHEDWRSVLSQFQTACIEQVHSHGGVVYECQGDGFLFFFGHPSAREDSASRAVQAALAIIDDCENGLEQVNSLLMRNGQSGLSIRAGVHSGYVVIGTQDGRELATGFPLAFTQRLHTCAAPNSLVISEETCHLLAGRFSLTNLGKKQLKGIEEPVVCFQVNSPSSRSKLPTDRSKFVGRHSELHALQNHWSQALSGGGNAQLLLGEAGIGKSRLMNEFLAGLHASHCEQLIWKCSPTFSSSALYPIVNGVSHFLGISPNDQMTSDHRVRTVLDAIELRLEGMEQSEPMSCAMSALFSIEGGKLLPEQTSISDSRKRTVLEGLVQWILAEGKRQPVCLLLEDVHWVDPSTVEFLELLLEQIDSSPVLLLMTCRSENSDSLNNRLGVDTMLLQRLDQHHSRELIGSMHGSKQLTPDDLDRLAKRSDGIPLFIEESTAMLVERELAASSQPDTSNNGHTNDPFSRADAVPVRLMDVLTARLDSTGDARYTAGLAASIGREFSCELLASVSELKREALDTHLDRLLSAGLLRQHESDRRILIFKHALVRDAAYASLLNSTKKSYHKRIAEALQSGRLSNSTTGAELLAYHFTQADDPAHAIDYWLLAGKIARLNSNPKEAIEHYHQVQLLLVSESLPVLYESYQKELQMQLGLGGCHIALEGYASDDARQCFEAAESIALDLGAQDKLIKVRFGLEAHYFMRGDFPNALTFAESCHKQASMWADIVSTKGDNKEAAQTRLTLAQSNWALGNVLFHQGKFSESMPLMDKCIELCQQPTRHHYHLAHDPGMMCELYRAWFRCESGELDQALESVERMVVEARQKGHVYTIGVTLAFNACIHLFRNEYDMTVERANESISHSEKPGFTTWIAWAKVLRGRALCDCAQTRGQGLEEVVNGLHLWECSGAIVTRPFTLSLVAESLLLNGQLKEADEHILKAMEMVDKHGERYFEAEINRLCGLIQLQLSPDNLERATQCFRHAIDFSRTRGLARSVMRSAIELARLQAGCDGVSDDVLNTLLQARKAVRGGAGTRDVVAADALIQSIGSTGEWKNELHLGSIDKEVV